MAAEQIAAAPELEAMYEQLAYLAHHFNECHKEMCGTCHRYARVHDDLLAAFRD